MDSSRRRCGSVMLNEDINLGNIGSGNGLFPDNTRGLRY